MVYAREACRAARSQSDNHLDRNSGWETTITSQANSHGYAVDEGAGLQTCSAQPSNGARHQTQYNVVAGGLQSFQWSASQTSRSGQRWTWASISSMVELSLSSHSRGASPRFNNFAAVKTTGWLRVRIALDVISTNNLRLQWKRTSICSSHSRFASMSIG